MTAPSGLSAALELRAKVGDLVQEHRRIVDDESAVEWFRTASALMERMPVGPLTALLLDLRVALALTFPGIAGGTRDGTGGAGSSTGKTGNSSGRTAWAAGGDRTGGTGRGPQDAVRAAEIFRRYDLTLRAALSYARAAVLTSFTDDVAEALDHATQALVCLTDPRSGPRALTTEELTAEERHDLVALDGQTEPALRASVLNSLGILCTEFYAYDRAGELYHKGVADAEICSEPGRLAALLNNLAVSQVYRARNEAFLSGDTRCSQDSCEDRSREGRAREGDGSSPETDICSGDVPDPRSSQTTCSDPGYVGLLEAERAAHRLINLSSVPPMTRSLASRLLADVLCEQGRHRDALERLYGTGEVQADNSPEQLQAKVDLTAARCLRHLGEHAQALEKIEAASRNAGPGAARSLRLAIVQERSLLREEIEDLDGALEDAWVAGEMIWRRHREQLGGLAAQLWDRAQAEGERRHLQHRADELARRAGQDPLTGLPNRRSMLSFLAGLHAHEQVFVLFADVDAFKRINDRYGHGTGDEVLRGIADVLDGSVRECDLAARWGGEEFLVVVTRVDAEAACEVADRIRCGVSQLRWAVADAQLQITMSVGVAGGHAACVDDIVQRADEALYQAKQTGRDRVVLR